MDKRLDRNAAKAKAYRIFCWVLVLILAFLFTFPLYWIITGSFKSPQEINNVDPSWFPKEFVLRNYEKLMSKRAAPLFDFEIFGLTLEGPKIPPALRPCSTSSSSAMSSPVTPSPLPSAGWSTPCIWPWPPCC